MSDRIEAFLQDVPNLHSWDGGKTWNSGGFVDWQLRKIIDFIRDNISNSPNIIETGAGNSTIAFLLANPNSLISIAPDEALFERIIDHCRSAGINASALAHKNGPSELILPTLLSDPIRYDFALIDGKHGWPAPFVDLCYCNYLVRNGGYIMVDDVQIKPCKEVASFLAMQPGYEIVLDIGKSLVFQKTTTDEFFPDWTLQPYSVECTKLISDLDPYALYSPLGDAANSAELANLKKQLADTKSALSTILSSRRYQLGERCARAYHRLLRWHS